MNSQGTPPLSSPMTMVAESQPCPSQAGAWPAFMDMVRGKGLDWAMGIRKAHEPEDSGMELEGPSGQKPAQVDLGPTRAKRAHKPPANSAGTKAPER